MKLYIKRTKKNNTCTIGNLFIDGTLFCNTLESPDLGLSDSMSESEIKKKMIAGKTAIPTGTYKVELLDKDRNHRGREWVKKYNYLIPTVKNVKGFVNVLIHPGNYASDRYGCILIGLNTIRNGLSDSIMMYDRFMKILQSSLEEIILVIE